MTEYALPVDPKQPQPELTVKLASPEALVAVQKALGDVKKRSFSGRRPELGKMIKCQVCGTRHRENERKCTQVFVTKWFEEDLETGEVTPILAVVGNTKRGIVGATAFKGRRINPHPSHSKLIFVETVRQLLAEKGFGNEVSSEEVLKKVRAQARKILHKKFRLRAQLARRQQDVSRRINRGLKVPGSR